MSTRSRVKQLLVLHIAILIYSCSAVLIKFAAIADIFSFSFFLFYCLALVALIFYALFWQQSLKHFKLSFAYMNRSFGMLWTVLFGITIFEETIGVYAIIGILLIIVGVIVLVTDD
ncbi:MAG: transporter [Oscillospiraceae bacterium]|nr:transporter [Oscillospiraceae bacterium]